VGLNDLLSSGWGPGAGISLRRDLHQAHGLCACFLSATHVPGSIYALLHAPLIAVLQVMVYGGAVMVLFVFAIMNWTQ